MRRSFHLLGILILLGMLSACGWQLRGNYDLPDELRRVQLSAADPLHPIVRRVERALTIAGVEISETASLTLRLERLEREQRNVALDRRARPSEKGIWLSLPMSVVADNGAALVGPLELQANRIYRFDPNNVVAMNEEEKLIENELQDTLVGQLMRRLQRIKPSALDRADIDRADSD